MEEPDSPYNVGLAHNCEETTVADNSALYGIIGAMGLVVAGSGAYIAKQHGAFDSPTTTAAVTVPAPAPAPAPETAPAPTPPSGGVNSADQPVDEEYEATKKLSNTEDAIAGMIKAKTKKMAGKK